MWDHMQILPASFHRTLRNVSPCARVTDPAARGLAQGGSAHGLGTAAMVNEPTAFAFSAVAMALTATASTVLVSIPPIRSALLSIVLGAAAVAPNV